MRGRSRDRKKTYYGPSPGMPKKQIMVGGGPGTGGCKSPVLSRRKESLAPRKMNIGDYVGVAIGALLLSALFGMI